jgi:hypothetical protein
MVEMVNWEYTVIPVKTRIHSNHFEGGSKPVIEDVQNDLNSLQKRLGTCQRPRCQSPRWSKVHGRLP